ncbi:MAG: Thymidylate kinase [Chlamydiae bacterium]|nr:Thymidylate kinase [Chlamydiota bacterium]
MKGHFVTFEGGDGAGKSSLIIGLHAALIERGHAVLQTLHPGGTEPGQIIRELVLHPHEPVTPKAELFLFLADRAHQVEKVIRPALEEGRVVLCDRYNDSTIAYQGRARGFGIEKVEELCQFATNNLIPDLTIYLDIDPEIGLQRIKEATGRKDQIEAADIELHKQIRETFLEIGRKNPARFQILDGTKSKEEVFEEALKLIDDHCFATNP